MTKRVWLREYDVEGAFREVLLSYITARLVSVESDGENWYYYFEVEG